MKESTLSIVTTLFKSENFIDDFFKRSLISAEKIFKNIEFIFVNDDSPDNSDYIISKLNSKSCKIRLINLSRNFGQHKAILTGLKYATGDYIWLLDSDLEDQPEWLISFYEKLKNHNADVIYGYNVERKTTTFNNFFAKLFYKVINKLVSLKIQPNSTTARLMKRNYKNALCSLNANKPLFFLFSEAGYKQIGAPVNKFYKGKSSYTFKMKLKIFLSSLLIYDLPLKLSLYSGIFFFLLSLVNILLVFINLLFLNKFLILPLYFGSLLFCTGFIIIIIGINIIYIKNKFRSSDDAIIKEILKI